MDIEESRQQLQRPQFENIPNPLKSGKQFVVWKMADRGNGDIGKVPYIARAIVQGGKHFRASTTKAQNWSTFPQTIAAYETGQFDGIGRILKNEILLDIDHCIQDNVIDPRALEVLAMFDSYHERSPRGDGIHIIFRGTLPDDLNHIYRYKGLKIELYSAGRYSTLTGVPLPGTPSITEIREQLPEIRALTQQCSLPEVEITGVCVCVCDAQPPDPTTSSPTNQLHTCLNKPQTDQHPHGAARPQIQAMPAIREEDLPIGDQLILTQARAAHNSDVFMTLWNGGDPRNRDDPSRADFDLALLLLYWSNDNLEQSERLFSASRRYRPGKSDRKATRSGRTNLQMTFYNAHQWRLQRRQALVSATIGSATPPTEQPAAEESVPTTISSPDPTPVPPVAPGEGEHPAPAQRSTYQRLHYVYDWMSRHFDQEERNQQLYGLSHGIKDRTVEHLQTQGSALYVAAAAPGSGKSHAYAEICDEINTSIIVPRHELIRGVAGYARQRCIESAKETNCPDWLKHQQLGEKGYNTRAVHRAHDCPCLYLQQFDACGSAIYQIAHSMTSYIAQHDAIIIEEFNLPDWLNEKLYTVETLANTAQHFGTESTANIFLVSWQATLTDLAQREPGAYQGKEILDLLNHHVGRNGFRGGLSPLLGVLHRDERATELHPWPADLEGDLPPVVLPQLYHAVADELRKWERGSDWNSCLRVTVNVRHRPTLHITKARGVNRWGTDAPRAIALADATANREILERWYGGEVLIDRPDIDPPPHMRHRHITERASKTSLTARHGRDQARIIRKLRFLLRDVDPDGSKRRNGQVGLVTYKGCEESMRLALEIPQGRTNHFWATRGSNALESCEILLVVGTPTLSPETVFRLARTLYHQDLEPITEGSHHDGHRWIYDDRRVDNLACYLTSAELTQCAHRHRPLRYDGRLTISICESDIDYLPVTETIVQMPRLTEDGEDRQQIKAQEDHAKLDQARRLLEVQGVGLGVHRLARAAHVATDTASRYLRALRRQAQTHTHTHTPVISPVPERTSRDYSSTSRYETGAEGRQESPPTVGTLLMAPHTGQACARCGQIDDWVRDPSSERWLCSCYYWWYDHPEWREGGPPQVNVG